MNDPSSSPSRPLVTVVIPCFNAARTVGDTIASAFAQTYRPIEIICVDDCSTDDTLAILRRWESQDVTVIASDRNGGAPAARNCAIAVARGGYLAFLDADDTWAPEKLERQLAVIDANPAMTLIGCHAAILRIGGQRQSDNVGRSPPRGAEAWRDMLHHSYFVPSVVVARTAAVRAVGLFNETLRSGEDDQDLFIRLALKGEVGFVDARLTTMHEQPMSLSNVFDGHQHKTTLPMILGHCRALAPRLGRRELRAILGARYAQAGRAAYPRLPGVGARLLLRAICYGNEPVTNFCYLLTAARWTRPLKAILRRERRE